MIFLCEFAALLKDGHTAVNRPGGALNPSISWPPLEVQVAEGKYIVARLDETKEITENKIYRGLEIIEIEGMPVDSFYQSNVVRFESRGTKHADEAINIYKIFSGIKNTTVNFKVRDLDGKLRSVKINRNNETKSGAPFFSRLFEWYMSENPIETKIMNDGILYIKIANFDSEAVVKEFLKMFDQVDWAAVKGVILDLRFNPGGDDAYAFPIITCFIDEPVKSFLWKSPKYIPAKKSWGYPQEWEQGFFGSDEKLYPREGKRYSGPLVILTGHSTYSTAEDFLIPLTYTNRAVLVGETTAGSSGNPYRVKLPGGGNFRVVTLRVLYPDGKEWVGTGIKPTVEVHTTQQDIFNGNDPILDKGIEVVKNTKLYMQK